MGYCHIPRSFQLKRRQKFSGETHTPLQTFASVMNISVAFVRKWQQACSFVVFSKLFLLEKEEEEKRMSVTYESPWLQGSVLPRSCRRAG